MESFILNLFEFRYIYLYVARGIKRDMKKNENDEKGILNVLLIDKLKTFNGFDVPTI